MTTPTNGPAMANEDVTLGEAVRTLRRIESKLDTYEAKFVPREVYAQQVEDADRRHVDLAKWVTDIAASLERTRGDMVSKKTVVVCSGTCVAALAAAAGWVSAFHK